MNIIKKINRKKVTPTNVYEILESIAERVDENTYSAIECGGYCTNCILNFKTRIGDRDERICYVMNNVLESIIAKKYEEEI